MYTNIGKLSVMLDSSVKHITSSAAMALSGVIQNGIMLTQNPNANIVIYKNRIDFGRSINPDLNGFSGLIFTNFYKEYENVIYRYGCNIKCSFWGNTLDYVGAFAPSRPDNADIYQLIYPKFA